MNRIPKRRPRYNSQPLAVLALFAFFLVACAGRGNESDAKFDVNIRDTGGSRVCEIVFTGTLPPPAKVDKIVRESLENAVRKDPSKDILAAAFLGDEHLNGNQYSGMLVYKAADKKIQTIDEYNGVKTSTTATSSYFVETEEQHTYPGITPPRTWLSLTIVFPKTPSRDVAYDAIFAEIQKVTNRGLDVDAYVSVGDKNVKTSWYQMRDDDGAYVFAEYKSTTKAVTRKGALLKELR
jgi:hypothetical protein